MTFLRRLFGLDFPDPQDGQVWRSRHSGRAFRVQDVKRNDCGTMWHLSLHHEIHPGNFNGIGMGYVMYPSQWRSMLRDEGRQLMGGGMIEPAEPWPRTSAGKPLTDVECWEQGKPDSIDRAMAADATGVGGVSGEASPLKASDGPLVVSQGGKE